MSSLLSDIVQNRIIDKGPISFHDFMEIALYYPDLGYYTSPKEKFGKEGDYFTAPFITNVFGSMIAKQLEEMWKCTGEKEFTIIEYGAGSGTLCADILNHLKNNEQFYKRLNYCIIEKSKALRKQQDEFFRQSTDTEKIKWLDSISEMPSITGCVLANEVLDNFSVHKVILKENELMEVFVDKDFTEVVKPAADDLKVYFKELHVKLPNDFCAEINMESIKWIKEISASLKRGFVLTIDYGFPSSELYRSCRNGGTIVCYYKHSVNDKPYINIGEQDITAHVNFSALHLWGERNGLKNCGFTTQTQFLTGLGLTDYMRNLELKEKNNLSFRNKLIRLHTLLISMGKKFKVLIQQKGLQKPMLTGLQFCQPL